MRYSLPLDRLFPGHPNARIMDCLLSNHGLGQSVENVVGFTGLKRDEAVSGLEWLAGEKLISTRGGNYVAEPGTGSARLDGLYAYYRATVGSNLDNAFPPG